MRRFASWVFALVLAAVSAGALAQQTVVANYGDNSLYVVDLSNGNRTVLSNSTTGTGPSIAYPVGIARNSSTGTIYVGGDTDTSVWSVDPSTGNRAVVSSSTVGTGGTLSNVYALAIDSSGNLIVPSYVNTAIYRVDPATGNRTTLASSSVGSGATMVTPFGVVVESDGNIVFTTRYSNSIIRLNPTTLVRTVVSSSTVGTGPALNTPTAILRASDGSLYVVNESSATSYILRVDPATGNRTTVTGSSTGTGPTTTANRYGASIASDGTLYFTTFSENSIVRVDSTTGNRSIVSSSSVGTGPAFNSVLGILGGAVASIAPSTNTAPVANAVSDSTNEDTAKAITLSATDSDTGQTLTYSIVAGPSNGTLGTVSGTSVTYTPTANYNGTDTFTYKANDGTADSNTATVTVTVSAVNDAPVLDAITDPTAILEDASEQTVTVTGVGTGGGSDESSQTVTLTATSSNTALIATVTASGTGANRTLTYTPVANANGTAVITVTADDAQSANNTATRTFTVAVTAVNDAPVLDAISDPTAINEDASEQTVTVTGVGTGGGSDESSQTVTVTASSGNTALIASVAVTGTGTSRELKYTPVANANGTAVITVTADDAQSVNNTATRTFTVAVTAVNDAPVASAVSDTTNEDTAKAITLSATDVDTSDTLTYSIVANPSNGTLGTVSGASVTYTPTANYNGTDTFTYKANDGTADSNTATVTVTVTAVNDAPVLDAITDPTAINEDASEQTVTVTGVGTGGGSDESSQTVTVTASSGNTALIASVAVTGTGTSRELKYTPVANANGTAVITVTADDAQSANNTATRTFTVAVTAVNDAPVLDAITDPTAINEDASEQTVTITGVGTGGGTDESSQTVTVTASSSNTALIASVAVTGTGTSRELKYTPVANANGTAVITVTADDAQSANNTATRTFTVAVTAVNDAPVLDAVTDPTAINEDASEQTVTVTGVGTGGGSDESSQTVTVTASSGNTALIASVAVTGTGTSRELKYTPVANANGTAVITVTADDAQSANNTATRTFTVTVNAVNDAPVFDVIADVSYSEDAGTQLISLPGVGPGGGSDESGQTVVLTATSSNTALFANPTTGKTGSAWDMAFSLVPDANGTSTVTVTANDFQSASNTFSRTFIVTVNAVNDAPILDAVTDPTAINEDASEQTVTVTGVGTGGGSDESSQTVTVTASSSNTALIASVAVTGTGTSRELKYTPVANANGTAVITVTADDAQSVNNTATRTFTVAVTAVNDAPVFDAIGAVTVNEDPGASTVTLTGVGTGGGSDESSQTVTVTATSSNTALIPNPSVTTTGATRTLTYTPVLNMNGSATITVTADDAQSVNNTATRTFTITVNAVNDAPVFDAIANPAAINEDASAQSVAVTGIGPGGGSDESSQTVTVTASSGNTALIATVAVTGTGTSRTLTYTPVADANGTAVITVKADDAQSANNTATRTFTVTVNAVEDYPAFDPVSDQRTHQGAGAQTVSISSVRPGNGTDEKDQSVTVTAFSADPTVVESATVSGSGSSRTLTYVPSSSKGGSTLLTITAVDSSALHLVTTWTLTVSVDASPTISEIAPQTTNEDTATGAIAFKIGDVESGSASLTVSARSTDTAVVPDADIVLAGSGPDRTVTLTPAANASGSANITISVGDGSSTATRTVALTVTPVNDPPTFEAIANPSAVDEDASEQTVTVTGVGAGGGSDESSQTVTVTASSGNAALIASVAVAGTGATRTLTYTPAANANGTAVITVMADDGQSANNTLARTFVVTVNPVNDAPVAKAQTVETDSAAPVKVTLAGSDVEDDALTIAVVGAPSNGTLSGDAPNLLYTPNKGYIGNDSFAYVANDGKAASAPATVSIVVKRPPNSSPLFSAPVAQRFREGEAFVLRLTATDPDSDPLAFALVSVRETTTRADGESEIALTVDKDGTLHALVARMLSSVREFVATVSVTDGVTEPVAVDVSLRVDAALPSTAPASLSAKPADTGVRLTWAADPKAASYAVYRSERAFANLSDATRIAGGLSAATTDDAAAPTGITLHYAVASANASGAVNPAVFSPIASIALVSPTGATVTVGERIRITVPAEGITITRPTSVNAAEELDLKDERNTRIDAVVRDFGFLLNADDTAGSSDKDFAKPVAVSIDLFPSTTLASSLVRVGRATPNGWEVIVINTNVVDNRLVFDAPRPGLYQSVSLPLVPWNVEDDGAIDITDIVRTASLFGESNLLTPRDVNGDGEVDIRDLALVASHFGESVSKAAPTAAPSLATSSPVASIRFDANRLDGNVVELRLAADSGADIAGYALSVAFDRPDIALTDVSADSYGFASTLRRTPNSATVLAARVGTESSESSGVLVRFRVEAPTAMSATDIARSARLSDVQLADSAGRRIGFRVVDGPAPIARRTGMLANFPNPFNPETWIPFELTEGSDVTLTVFDVSGNVVRRLDVGYREPGSYASREDAVYWDGRNELGEAVGSGVYVVEFRANTTRTLRRIAVVR